MRTPCSAVSPVRSTCCRWQSTGNSIRRCSNYIQQRIVDRLDAGFTIPLLYDFYFRIQNMGIKCGIVGLPNVGKSTLFNALTKAGIAAANFPFCTIEPNVGIVPVPDTRLAQLAEIVKPQRVIPTTMEFVDIAGLVAGASKGE